MTVGGGRNHRLNLAAMVPLEENHIAAAGGVTTAIDALTHSAPALGLTMMLTTEPVPCPR